MLLTSTVVSFVTKSRIHMILCQALLSYRQYGVSVPWTSHWWDCSQCADLLGDTFGWSDPRPRSATPSHSRWRWRSLTLGNIAPPRSKKDGRVRVGKEILRGFHRPTVGIRSGLVNDQNGTQPINGRMIVYKLNDNDNNKLTCNRR